MDFTSLNTKNAAEKGAFLHLKHPVWGHPLYTGEGAPETDPQSRNFGKWTDKAKDAEKVGLLVRGTESATVQGRLKDIQAQRMKNKDADDMEQNEETDLAFAGTLIIGFVGFDRDGKPLEPTEDNKRAFFGQSDDFVSQVLDFAQERANFFKDASTA